MCQLCIERGEALYGRTSVINTLWVTKCVRLQRSSDCGVIVTMSKYGDCTSERGQIREYAGVLGCRIREYAGVLGCRIREVPLYM